MEGAVTYSYEIVTDRAKVAIRIEYTAACLTKEEAEFSRVLRNVWTSFGSAMEEMLSLYKEISDNIDIVHNANWQQRMSTGISEMETQLGAIRALEPIESFQEIYEGSLAITNIWEDLVYYGRIILAAPNDEVILTATLDSAATEIPQLAESMQSLLAMAEDRCS